MRVELRFLRVKLRFLRLLPPFVLATIGDVLVGEFGTGDQTELREELREDPAFDSFLPKDVTAPDKPVLVEEVFAALIYVFLLS